MGSWKTGPDLEVRLRKTKPRLPVVLEVKEALAVQDKIEEKTTEIYTHVAKGVGAMGVKSPLDRLEWV